MRNRLIAGCLLAAAVAATPLIAQSPPMAKPGAADASRVKAGTYAIEPSHTQIGWSLDHMGFTPYMGSFSNASGSLTLDPAKPSAATLEISVPISSVQTTSAKLTEELVTKMFFDAGQYPTATFKSTSIVMTGASSAKVVGDLTLHGVTKPITIAAKFYGAGVNGMSKKLNVGFTGAAVIKRSDFGMGMMVPLLGDEVTLAIVAAFQQ